ncbi:hypothetical protein J6590_076633 [Homalodisca vitripennis]|nr:hypothetical protein J6590_076633 [Homalodisca vitripennis]
MPVTVALQVEVATPLAPVIYTTPTPGCHSTYRSTCGPTGRSTSPSWTDLMTPYPQTSEDIRREMEGLIGEEDGDIVYDSDADIFDNEENEANSFDLMDIEIDSNATNSELLNSDVSVIQTPEPDLPENVGLPHNAVSTENDPLCNICQWHHSSNFEPKNFEFDEANSGLHLEVDGKPLET